MGLQGKVALVTGSTSGIGLGIAHALAKAGANICINGFGDAAEIEKVRKAIETDFKVKAIYSPADMSKPAEIAAMVKHAEDTLGSVDILVNNAGIQYVAPIEEFPVEKWDQIIAINLSASFHAIRAAVPGMKKRGWGRIINTASAHSLVASPYKVGLCLGQARHRRLDQDRGAGAGDLQDHLQLHFAGLCLDAAGREADSRHDEGASHDQGAGHQRRAAGRAADQGVRHHRAGGGVRALSVRRRGQPDHRRESIDGRRMDGRMIPKSGNRFLDQIMRQEE